MKTLAIYKRQVTERTRFKKYRFKEVTQYSIVKSNVEIIKNHDQKYDNERLVIKFDKVLETRKKSDVENFIAKLGRSDADQFLKKELETILKGL